MYAPRYGSPPRRLLSSPSPSAAPSSSPAFNHRLADLTPRASPSPSGAGPSSSPGAFGASGSSGGEAHAPAVTPSRPSSSPFGPPPASPFAPQTSPFGQQHTPSSRRPPTRSILDTGPGVLSLRTSSPSASPYTPISAAPAPAPGRWVTVFGFGAGAEEAVVREMRRHGEIVARHGGRGNWVHLCYASAGAAGVAMHRPWRMVDGVMVGVTDCTEREVCERREEDVALVAEVRRTPLTPRTPKSVAKEENVWRSPGYGGATPRTPMSVRTPNVGMDVSPAGHPSILKEAPPPRSVVSYISDWMSGA